MRQLTFALSSQFITVLLCIRHNSEYKIASSFIRVN